jgi:hypothetical protein
MAWSLAAYSISAFTASALSAVVAGLTWRHRAESHALSFVGLTQRAGGETPLKHGSGLGLWVANWITGGPGGELRIAEDTSPGATVALTFPVRDAPEEGRGEQEHRDVLGPEDPS